ncbi:MULTISPECIES: iron-siderophore ABC transporter substrate-binding protein [Nocardiaceae]|uniref:Iron complex transport system substrate-binding protein n=1 Tax=Rhodococcoides corynebacterioides TaxID=53972 RepID=A0ABS2KSM0_9NOCA|nr:MULTISPECIES: iron-siderophore ABC transporter substrate-binding protein [Rhodococcus]MBM7414771.1 iron complex transport system substrate-binding protein [Rhodococcus corynebacterioides]MBP1117233.1 iron complex transport system substrate-binding protein [Rhodococcus sp. PvP016]
MKRSRLLPAVAATAALALVAGCSSDADSDAPAAASSGAFPVTIDHAFGSTTIDAAPERIVTMGWNAQDILGALDITPVGQPKYTYGADENGVMPWAQEFYDADATTLYEDPAAGEPDVEALATLAPDLVLAPYEGFPQSYYDTLSAVSPVVAYPGEAWQTTWQDQTTMIGEAVGKPTEAQALIDGMGQRLASEAEANPEFAGKTVAVVNLDTDTGQANVYMPSDPRVQVLNEMGFVNAPGVVALDEADSADTFFSTVSLENVQSFDADVIVAFTPEGYDLASVPALATLPAVASGSAVALSDEQVIAGLSNVNPVSTPWVLDRILPQLKDAATKAA